MHTDARNETDSKAVNPPLTFASAARVLGASRSNLSRAVRGKISNAELLARYRSLVALRASTSTTKPV